MKKYQVTQTATAEVWARNEIEAIEMATGEFFDFPEYNHEVTDITPNPRLHEIVDALREMGVSAYVDDYKNNTCDLIRLSLTEPHPDYDEGNFMLQASLDENNRYDGKQYDLITHDCYDVATYDGNLHPLVIAYLVLQKLKGK